MERRPHDLNKEHNLTRSTLTPHGQLLTHAAGLAERCSDVAAEIGVSLVERPDPQRLADAARVLADLAQRLRRLRCTLAVAPQRDCR
jgi:hypothetical protein